MKAPEGYKEYLSEYGPIFYEGEEPVAWGFKLLKFMGEEKFTILKTMYDVVATGHDSPTLTWYAVVKYLSPKEAKKKYGAVTSLVTGPKGGFKNVTYGTMRFSYRHLDPRKEGIKVPVACVSIQ